MLRHATNDVRRFFTTVTAATTDEHTLVDGRRFPRDSWTNVTPRVLSHLGRNLHLQEGHPLDLVRRAIVRHPRFAGFDTFDALSPAVSVRQNFDDLLVPPDHPSRARGDCYYLNEGALLRAHTTAHLADLVRDGCEAYLVSGDVYRRDEIDSTHYPVFHQLDGFRLARGSDPARLEADLKSTLVDAVRGLLGGPADVRWIDAVFPFTHPSWELEASVDGRWIEVLGCGVVRAEILRAAGVVDGAAYAFGTGLERVAMALYGVPDIRLFWSRDEGFLGQFRDVEPGRRMRLRPVSAYPPTVNDLSFWLAPGARGEDFVEGDLFDLVRDEAGELVERVRRRDTFVHPGTGRTSVCYRIAYRHPERTLTKEEVNRAHARVARAVERRFGATVR